MKKSILISAITASVVFANDTIVLDEVITISSATKSEKSIDGVSASVEVITQKEIEKMGASTIKDIFSKTPGLNVQYGTFPSASSKSKGSITLRGMGAKGTLILIDGKRVGGEVANPYDLDRISANIIEKIEVVKGPMSTLYGADATGGIINIITKKPKSGEPQIGFGIRYGQSERGYDKNKNINFDIRGKEERLGYSAYINYNETTPYSQSEVADVYAQQGVGVIVKPSAHVNPALSGALKDSYITDVTYREKSEVFSYGGRFEYDINDDLRAGFDINGMKEERDGRYIGYFHPTAYLAGGNQIPAYNVPVDSKDDNKRLDYGVDLEIMANEDLMIKLRAYQSRYKKRNTTTALYYADMGYGSKEASANNGLDADVKITTYEAMANYVLNDDHFLTGGIENREEQRDATVFTQANTLTRKSVDYKAYYLQDEWMIDDDLNLTFGARYDDISNAKSKATYKIGAVKNYSKEFNLRANYAQGYKTPDIRELYINKQTPAGVQRGADLVGYDLKPDFTQSYELGFRGSLDNLSYDLALFYNDIKDMIAEVDKGAYRTFENLSKAKTYGSELSLEYQVSDDINTRFAYNELKTKNKQTSKDLEFNPNRVISAFVDIDLTNEFDMNLGARYIGNQYFQNTYNRGTPAQTTVDDKTGGFMTYDMGINYAYDQNITLYAGINNILDKKIDDVLGSGSGRYYFTGMRVNF
ncbi:MAG: TonB-dependent receptor [Arcobacteraceae bacterium]|nr:TonB-dependent receptor [Arcobacteraceae bacterium]